MGDFGDPWRCYKTGHPVGTDTVMLGEPPCDCSGCRASRLFAGISDPAAFVLEAKAIVVLLRRHPDWEGRDILNVLLSRTPEEIASLAQEWSDG